MFRLTPSELRMCEVQGEFFVKSLEFFPNLSSFVFIRRFMKSNLARHLDQTDYFSDCFSLITLADRLSSEFDNDNYGKEKLSIDVLYWIGFVYRYWSYYKKMSSSTIFSIANGNFMADNYFECHTYSNINAVNVLINKTNFKHNASSDLQSQLVLTLSNKN